MVDALMVTYTLIVVYEPNPCPVSDSSLQDTNGLTVAPEHVVYGPRVVYGP